MTVSRRPRLMRHYFLALCGVVASFFVLWQALPVGVDWGETFSKLPAHWQDPFVIPSFANPPWVTVLLPHTLLSLRASNAVNMMLNIVAVTAVVRAANGGRVAIALALTSPLFFDLARTNNIDWIPLLGLVAGPTIGLPLVATKPQAVGGAALVWGIALVRARDWKRFLPFAIVLALSLGWGFWFLRLNLPSDVMWNFAPFPFGVPFGAWLLWRAIKTNDLWLGAIATPFLTPYVAPYSLAGLLGVVLARYPTIGKTIWGASWIYLIVELRRIALST